LKLRKHPKRQKPELREFPYPYRAALSICSDIDHTRTKEEFEAVRSLITDKIGLKFSSGFFPFEEENDFSLFSGREGDKEVIINSIRKGHMDAIHSYGSKRDLSREDAKRALIELTKNNCRLEVWIDHADSGSNFCKFRCMGRGDVPGAREYHADLTSSYGIKFIWTEYLTNLIGQDVPFPWLRLGNAIDVHHPLLSALNVLKTGAKLLLGEFGSERYKYYRKNRLVNISTLADGRKMFEFVRFNNYPRNPRNGDSFEELYYLISPRVLRILRKRGGYALVYVHLGKNFYPESDDGQKTVAALQDLKKEQDKGTILVDSTVRILKYHVAHEFLCWTSELSNDGCLIRIDSIDDPISGSRVPGLEELWGLTFYAPKKARLFIRDDEVKTIKRNPADHTGRESLTIAVNSCP